MASSSFFVESSVFNNTMETMEMDIKRSLSPLRDSFPSSPPHSYFESSLSPIYYADSDAGDTPRSPAYSPPILPRTEEEEEEEELPLDLTIKAVISTIKEEEEEEGNEDEPPAKQPKISVSLASNLLSEIQKVEEHLLKLRELITSRNLSYLD